MAGLVYAMGGFDGQSVLGSCERFEPTRGGPGVLGRGDVLVLVWGGFPGVFHGFPRGFMVFLGFVVLFLGFPSLVFLG